MIHLAIVGGLLATLLGFAGCVVHDLRRADAREIEQLAAVAQHNADTALRVQANARQAAETATHAAARAKARHKATQAQLRALEEANDDPPSPDQNICPQTCLLRWSSVDPKPPQS